MPNLARHLKNTKNVLFSKLPAQCHVISKKRETCHCEAFDFNIYNVSCKEITNNSIKLILLFKIKFEN